MSTLITLKQVCVTFNRRNVLDLIDFSIKKGQIVTLIGPNGAGKSTLVRVLLNLQKHHSGEVIRHQKLTIGYVPQKLMLNESLPLTVMRFLQLSGSYSPSELNTVLDQVGASHLSQNNMHQLSGGENQRILLARALLRKPDLLVLDEPAQGVDIQGQIELYDLIVHIRNQLNCAVFMVSHDLHLVMAKSDSVICLQHHICCSGTPADIKKHPSYLALFGLESHSSLALYHHDHQHHYHDLAGSPKEIKRSCCSNGVHSSHSHQDVTVNSESQHD